MILGIPSGVGASNKSPMAVARWLASWVAVFAAVALGARAGQ
jgi:hypothetical protein